MSDAQRTVPRFELRHRLGLALEWSGTSVGDMAETLGVHRNTVGNYLNGRTRPRRSVLVAWALRCGVPLSWLITGEPPDPDDPSTIWQTHIPWSSGLLIAA
jgi:transcriptional regulator with XRE-family HTH domain